MPFNLTPDPEAVQQKARQAVQEGLQILGGSGYLKGYPLKRYFRDAKAGQIYEGTNEINVALAYGLIPLEEVLAMLKNRPGWVEVALTGRQAPPELVELADLVTEMRPLKHYYAAGVPARRGIEWEVGEFSLNRFLITNNCLISIPRQWPPGTWGTCRP
ncbi:MAG: cob(I)yrinic acid a,c-diamide adenosyltransferase [Thermodesulfobacteriota bacterium]